jgi:hypothetical protein
VWLQSDSGREITGRHRGVKRVLLADYNREVNPTPLRTEAYAVHTPGSLLMLEFLRWVSSRRRTYAEAMEAWRSNCPRQTVWEDALADGLIELEGGERLREYAVVLTPRGQAFLSAW